MQIFQTKSGSSYSLSDDKRVLCRIGETMNGHGRGRVHQVFRVDRIITEPTLGEHFQARVDGDALVTTRITELFDV